MDKLANKLLDFGLNHYAEGLEDAPDTAEDDQLDEDSLASVLGLRGGAAMKAMKVMKAMAAMKAMKAMAAMKAMKKSNRASKIAKGKFAKALVFRGTKAK